MIHPSTYITEFRIYFTFLLNLFLCLCLPLFFIFWLGWKIITLELVPPTTHMSPSSPLIHFGSVFQLRMNQPEQERQFEHASLQGSLVVPLPHHCWAWPSASHHSVISQNEHVSIVIKEVIAWSSTKGEKDHNRVCNSICYNCAFKLRNAKGTMIGDWDCSTSMIILLREHHRLNLHTQDDTALPNDL